MDNKGKLEYAIPIIIAIIFLLIVHKGLASVQPGDENVYYYMAKLIGEGKVPYKDFFYAHPPLQIYILALVYGIAGFNVLLLKMVPLISALITAYFIFKISQAKFGYHEGVLALILFLFSYGVMFNSVFSFGIMTATMFLVIGFYFSSVKDNYIIAGIFFGLAGLTRLLALIPIAVFLAAALLSNRKSFIKLLSSFLAVFLFVNLLIIAVAGSQYIDSVYRYHFLKAPSIGSNFSEYFDILKLNWILFASAALLIFAKERKKVVIFALMAVVYLAAILLLKRLFGFYFIAAFPFLAIVGGYSLANVYRNVHFGKKLKVLFAIAFALIFIWNLTSDTTFLWKVGYIGFDRGNDIVGFVSSNSAPHSMIFGDDSAAPLVALMTGRSIAHEVVDTNNQVFASGLVNLKSTLDRIKDENVLFIARSNQGISAFPEVTEFLNNDCQFLSQFHDKNEGDYLVYRC